MECLDIPVDHRLVTLIKRVNIPAIGYPSTHLDILLGFGQNAKRGDEAIPSNESHHSLELAGPAVKGGVLILLHRPPRNQTFDNGYTADVSSCRTTSAVKDLIFTATNQQLTIDEVNVFDTLPHSPEGCDDSEFTREAEVTCRDMVKVKEPDVVLCCYQGDSNDELLKNLSSLGVGKVFHKPDHPIHPGWITHRVNAFHPSCAVNHNATYSCLRRLLLLEFVQAFSRWSEWKEESWMKDLRSECRSLARQLWEQQDQKRSQHQIAKDRWEEIMHGLTTSFAEMQYFRLNVDRESIRNRLIKSKLSWHCADASLFLEKFGESKGGPRFVGTLLRNFCRWWEQACQPVKPQENFDRDNHQGYFNPQIFSKVIGEFSDPYSRSVQGLFYSFLKDLNLSFSKNQESNSNIHYNVLSQKSAFLRFSRGLENTASRILSLSADL